MIRCESGHGVRRATRVPLLEPATKPVGAEQGWWSFWESVKRWGVARREEGVRGGPGIEAAAGYFVYQGVESSLAGRRRGSVL